MSNKTATYKNYTNNNINDVTCSTHGRIEKWTHNYVPEIWRRGSLGRFGIDGNIILKWVLRKQWIKFGLICLRIGCSCEFLWTW